MIKTKKKIRILNRSGFSLLELIIAVALFSLTIIMAAGIFQTVTNSQREAVASQEMQENTRYSMEKMSKELRTAQKDKTHSCIPSGNIYWVNAGNTALQFLNFRGQCICYYLINGNLMTSGGGCENGTQENHNPVPLMPQRVKVSNLIFKVTDSGNHRQANVIFKMRVENIVGGQKNKKIDIETSLSSRFYE
jgi:prepilin-type N-terminal cleavage/methylation domain-containing protein